MPPVSPTHAAALEYASRGWSVFPLKAGAKEPATANGHLEATADPARINAWWGTNPNYNVGIAVAPSGLVVLDVDTSLKKDGTQKRGRDSLAKIEHELAPTLLAETGRGGLHVVYARPPGVEPHRHINIIEKDSGLDLIGEGYIVAAPSYLAESGRHYRWTQQHPIAPLPPFLTNVSRAPRVVEKVQTTGTPIIEGNRNNALFRLGCALRDTGIGAEALARALDAENKTRFNPPVDDFELGTIVNSVLQRVQVTRDIALGAVVQEEIKQIFAPPSRSEWLENVGRTPAPPVHFYPTGSTELDRLLNGGFATRQMIGIMGPPSAGKSSLLGHWLLLLSKVRPVLHCSLELPRHEVFVRYAANQIGFPWVDGIKGLVAQDSMASAVRGLRIRILGQEDLDKSDPWGGILVEAEKIYNECGVHPIIAVDYVQLMARGAADQMRHKVGELTERGRQISQALDTIVFAVFTTARDTYGGKTAEAMRQANDPTVYLRSGKESGEIEYDAATLLYLDVDKLYDGPEKPARLAIARTRYGNVGFVGMQAQLATGKFREDAAAMKAFDADARKARQEAETLEGDCAKLLAIVEQLPGRPTAELVKASRLSGSRWRDARQHLIDTGAIFEDEVRENGHRVPNAKTLRKRNSASPTPVLPEEDAS